MRKCLVLHCVALLAISAAFAQTHPPVKLALIGADPSLRPALDLLTVEFSGNPKIALLERTEIDRVLHEYALSTAGNDWLKLGHILGADGLLIANSLTVADGEFLGWRLVAVKPGVVLEAARLPKPPENSAEWVPGMAARFVRQLAKLRVPARDAVPLSVVNLRSAVRSREAQELERQVAVLVVERLSREPRLFVLERRDLATLAFEKELAGETNGFWNGSHLLEGTLDRDGYRREQVTLSVELKPPQNVPPIKIEVAGSRTNLSEVVERLSAEIVARLKLTGAETSWNPRDEAERFLDEARWAYRWRMLTEAAAASEVGWALGRRNREVAALRIRAYYEDGVDRVNGYYDIAHKLVLFAPATRPTPGELTMPAEPLPGCGILPDHARFQRVRRALELYCSDFPRFISPDPKPDWEWHDLGLDLVIGASYWLRHYYYAPEGRAGQEGSIAAVQELAREAVELIGAHPAYTNDTGRSGAFTSRVNWGAELPGQVRVMRERETVAAIKADWGAYWGATPEEGVRLYRELIERGQMPLVRSHFTRRDFSAIPLGNQRGGTLPTPGILSYLTGWKWADRERVLAVWERFIEELCSAPAPRTRAEGLFLRCAQAPDDHEHYRIFRELVALLDEQREEMAAEAFEDGLLKDLRAVVESRGAAGLSAGEQAERKRVLDRLQQRAAESKAIAVARERLVEPKRYLAAGQYDFQTFARMFSRLGSEPAEARELLPALQTYRSNLTVQAESLSREIQQLERNQAGATKEEASRLGALRMQQRRLHSAQFHTGAAENRMKGTLEAAARTPPSPAPTVSSSKLGVKPAAANPSVAVNPIPSRPASAAPPPWAVTRFWLLPDRLPQASEPSQLWVATWCFREGRLWLDARAMRLGTFAGEQTYFNRAAIFAVDLNAWTSEAIALDPQKFSLGQRQMLGDTPRGFEIHGEWLYVSSTDVIRRYSLQTRRWEDLPVPVQGHARIHFLGNRLIVSTEDTILEASPDGKEVRILASGRRNPPATSLDTIGSYQFAPVMLGEGKSWVTFAGGKFYARLSDGKDWTLVASAPELLEATCSVFDAGLVLTRRSLEAQEVFGLMRGSHSPELWFRNSTRAFQPPNMPPTVRQSPSPPLPSPRWQLPAEATSGRRGVCLESNTCWVISCNLDQMRRPAQPGSATGVDAVLVCFEREKPKPLTVRLHLQLPVQTGSGRPTMGGIPGPPIMESTPAGLVIALPHISGFFLVPRNELEQRLKAEPQALRAQQDQSTP